MNKQTTGEYPRKESNFSTGLFWGAILGAVGMFLFATKKGKNLQKYLSENGEKILEELEEVCKEKEVRNKVKKLIEPVKKATKRKTQATEETKEIAHIAKLQERGRKTARKFFSRKGKSLK